MYKKRLVGLTLLVTTLAVVSVFTAAPPLTFFSPLPSKTYPGNHAFVHAIGTRHAYGWEAYYRQHHPGYFVGGLLNGGDVLAEGIYRYNFYFAIRPGHLASLLSGADDVVRLEAVDTTTNEVLQSRTFQLVDFKGPSKKLIQKYLTFSTGQRKGHHFEPRVYWHGLSGLFMQRVELVRLGEPSWPALHEKAALLEESMARDFLERGYVVTRDSHGAAEDTDDAAMWTGLYAAAEAWRYKATQEKAAERNLEKALWALHALCRASPEPGTLARYVDADGRLSPQPASKDTYTGFFYAAAQALPYVRDPMLKKAILSDLRTLADHFLDHDFAFVSAQGQAVDMNPYPSQRFITQGIDSLNRDAALRRSVIQSIHWTQWYFWIHGERSPASFARLSRALKHPSPQTLERELLPFLNDLRTALKTAQQNVHRSALRGSREGLAETPYAKLDLLLLRTLRNLDVDTGGRPFRSIEDLKILPSESLHALHFLKVAAEALPKPNRFDEAYRANLYDNKALLRTAIQWHQFDEDVVTAVLGQTEADTRRTASAHLSYLALHDLILLEKDPIVRFEYQKLFEQQFQPMSSDGNAMIDAMHAAVGLSTKQLGLALWSLNAYPVDRLGRGDAYWDENRKTLLRESGGEVNRQAREPLPPDLRPRDAFLWQRSAHSIRGDEEGWLYPPLDFLFAYWLARTTSSEIQTRASQM